MIRLQNHLLERPLYLPSVGKGIRLFFFVEHYDETIINYNLMSERQMVKFQFMKNKNTSSIKMTKTLNHSKLNASNFYDDFFPEKKFK